MTPAEVIERLSCWGRMHAHVCGDILRIRWTFGPVLADLPIVGGRVDAGYVCYLLSEID